MRMKQQKSLVAIAALFLVILISHSYALERYPTEPDIATGDTAESKPYVSWYGGLRGIAYGDTRKVLGSRDEYWVYLPAPYLPSAKLGPDELSRPSDPDYQTLNVVDLNAHAKIGASFSETRLGVKYGGYALGKGWNTDGFIEADFFGVPSFGDWGNANDHSHDHEHPLTLRLRYACLKIKDESREILFGQFTHPADITECYAHTVSFSFGGPYEPVAYCPQLRFTQIVGRGHFTAVASVQHQYSVSPGPSAFVSHYQRWSCIPEMTLQAYAADCGWLCGGQINLKKLVPRIKANFTGPAPDNDVRYVKTSESVNGGYGMLFAAWQGEKLGVRAKGYVGYNIADLGTIAGYAVTQTFCGHPEVEDPMGYRSYVPLGQVAGWLDFDIALTEKLKIGCFFGALNAFQMSRGLYIDPLTHKPIVYNYDFLLGNYSVRNSVRIAPRFIWKRGPLEIASEFEATECAYGTYDTTDNFVKVVPNNIVCNVRVMFFAGYSF